MNKCGFQINEFFCEQHLDPHLLQEDDLDQEDVSDDSSDDGFFSFNKIMKLQKS